MPSSTLKRSAATLGVLAGLLAAAAPASAQILDGPIMKAPVRASCLVDFASGVCYFHTVKAPASPTSQVFTSVSNVAAVQGGIVPGGAIDSARSARRSAARA